MINGMSSQSRLITETQRDSIFSKIQRGKIDAERVVFLRKALASCDSIKKYSLQIRGIQNIQIDSLYKVISNDKIMIKTLEDVGKLEVKRGRRRGMFGLLKGVAIGAAAVLILTAL